MISPISRTLLSFAGLLIGAFVAVMAFGKGNEERTQLTARLNDFQQLTDAQKNSVRKSFTLLSSQSDQRRSTLAEIYQQTVQDPELKATMDRYFELCSTLTQSERNAFLDLDAEERLDFVKTRWSTRSQVGEEIIVEFSGPEAVRMPTLHLTFDEYWTIISTAVPDSERPESLSEDLRKLSSNKHKALKLTFWVFERFKEQMSNFGAENHGEQFKDAMLKNIHDDSWITKFRLMIRETESKPFAKPWLFMTLVTVLDKAAITLGDDLRKQFPVTSAQIVDAFAALNSKSDEDKTLQRQLMTLPTQEARKRLELLAQTVGEATPEQELLTQYNAFTIARQAYLRGPFGFGGPNRGPGPDRPPGPPTDGSRPDGPPPDGPGRNPSQPQ